MLSAEDYGVVEDEQTEAVRNRLLAHIKTGEEEQERLIRYCAANIPRDRYVHPKLTKFDVAYTEARDEDYAPMVISYARGPSGKPWSEAEALLIHDHALKQLADIAGLRRPYLNVLNEASVGAWRRSLMATNFNELFKHQVFLNKRKKEAQFLHRIVGRQLRGVLTQSYNRQLVSAVVLQPFVAVCKEVGLQPVRATITDTRVHLQTYLPYAFQPVPGEFIALGTCWGNSDFGEGKLKISHSILRLTMGYGSLITEDAFSRVHIGSVIEETDLKIDDETAAKELDAVAAASQSAVRDAMSPERVSRVLNAIRAAHEEKVSWAVLKGVLAKYLNNEEVKSVTDMLTTQITELPPVGVGSDGNPLPSKWWAAAALAYVGEKQTNPSTSMELKKAAGTFLEDKDSSK